MIGRRPRSTRFPYTTLFRPPGLSCSDCGVETRGELPAGVPQGAFGPRLQALVALLSGRYHLSKRETQELMADFFGADMSLGAVSTLEQRTSQAVREPVEQAREYLQTQPVVHADETGWREGNPRAWLWVAVTASGKIGRAAWRARVEISGVGGS
mgnify:CR=1 FL=1